MSWANRSCQLLICAMLCFALSGCASSILQYKDAKQLEQNEDYDRKVTIKEIPSPPPTETPMAVTATTPAPAPDSKKKSKSKAKAAIGRETKNKKDMAVKNEVRQPDIEDTEGFKGRRPLIDPFRPGEKVTLSLTYFNMVAGYLELQVLPFVEVNGEKAYGFQLAAKSNSLFSRFYSVDDRAKTFLNYETLLPMNFEISVKESKQLADIRSFFDWKNLKGNYWEKRVSKDKGERNKNIEWDIKPFSQNVISAIFYLRAFTLTPGKNLAFRVADEGKNIVFTAEVLRKEVLSTDLGDLNTVVVKPKITVDGVFTPVGDILIWLTDDARKFVVRIESKIKIGTIVGKLKSIERAD